MNTVSLLLAEPRFGSGLDEVNRRSAEQSIQVQTLSLRAGPVTTRAVEGGTYLVLQGTLLRRLHLANGRSVELLASGDVLMPGEEDAASFARSEWEAVEPTQLAVLDLSPDSPISRRPSVSGVIAHRSIDRSRALALQAAIMSIVGVEERLHVLLWALAERRGRVTRSGIELVLNLPQGVLGEMIGARRPSVNTALGRLTERGLLVRSGSGRWLLLGDPPGS